MTHRMRRWAQLVLIGGFVSIEVAVATDQSALDIHQLFELLEQTPRTTSRFTEQQHIGILDQPITSSGTLTFVGPTHLEKHVLTPVESRFVVTADRLTIESANRSEQKTYRLAQQPALKGFVEAFRATLSGDLQSLQRFYELKIYGTMRKWRLELTPTDAEVKKLIRYVRVHGSNGVISSVDIEQRNGDWSRMTIVSSPQ